VIFYILSNKHTNKIALRVGWKICCWYLAVVTLWRARRCLYGQCTFAVEAMAICTTTVLHCLLIHTQYAFINGVVQCVSFIAVPGTAAPLYVPA
jgi:hypothetical protein